MVLDAPAREEEIDGYLRNMSQTIAPGGRVHPGVADTVMPFSLIERVERIRDRVDEYRNSLGCVPTVVGAD